MELCNMSPSATEHLYETMVRRGFSRPHSAVDVAGRLYVSDYPLETYRMYDHGVERSGQGVVTNPFLHIVPVTESPPPKMYDSSVPGTWVYPIWKYLYEPEFVRNSSRDVHRPYSSFKSTTYLAGEMDYFQHDLNRALDNVQRWRKKCYDFSPYRGYVGHIDLRHFGGFRPHTFETMTPISPWK